MIIKGVGSSTCFASSLSTSDRNYIIGVFCSYDRRRNENDALLGGCIHANRLLCRKTNKTARVLHRHVGIVALGPQWTSTSPVAEFYRLIASHTSKTSIAMCPVIPPWTVIGLCTNIVLLETRRKKIKSIYRGVSELFSQFPVDDWWSMWKIREIR